MPVGVLSIDIEARLAKLEAGMSQATRIAERNAAQIEARYAKIGTTMRNLAGSIASAFSVRMFAQFVAGTILGLDALNDLRDATGASIENLSALEDTARRTGTSFDTVQTALIKFNNVLRESKPGSEFANVFKAIGLNAEELKRLDPAEALLRTAQALAGFADDGNKARIVAALFGKSIGEVAPLLKDLAEKGSLNATLTKAQTDAAEKFANQLRNINKDVTDAARGIVTQMLPALSRLAQAFSDTLKAGGSFDIYNARLAAKAADTRRNNVFKELTALQEEIAQRGGATPRLSAELKAIEADYEAATRAAIDASERVKELTAVTDDERRARQRGSGFGGSGFDPSIGGPLKRAADVSGIGADKTANVKRDIATFADDVNRSLSKMIEDTDLIKLETLNAQLARLEELAAAGLDPRIVDQVRGLLGAQRGVGPDIPTEILEKRKTLSKEIADIEANTPTAKLQQKREVLQAITDEYLQGKYGLVGTTEAMQRFGEVAQTALGTLPEQWQKTADEMGEFAREAARNIQDALGDTVLRTLKGDFDSIGDLWADLLQRMVAQVLSARLGELFLGQFASTGKVGGLFGDFLGLFGLAKGGAFEGGVQTFASGGIVSSPRLFPMARGMGLMGEAGPEAIMPLRRGRDGKLGVASQGGGMTIINNVAAGVSRNEVLTALQLTAQSLRSEFSLKLRAAGVA